MKTKLGVGLLCLVAVVMAGCAGANVEPGAELTEEGIYRFVAQGTSAVAREDDALALVEARTAAETLAKANLLEKIKGARITNSVTIGDLMFASQEANLRMRGYLSRATVSFVDGGEFPESPLITATAVLELDEDDLTELERYATRAFYTQ